MCKVKENLKCVYGIISQSTCIQVISCCHCSAIFNEIANNMGRKCIECGCACKMCLGNDQDVHLHLEIENLKHQLLESKKHIVEMESNLLKETHDIPDIELISLRDELTTWQEKYQRLYEAHARIQRVNQGLEDKLLKLVDTNETEKTTLVKDVAILSKRLAEANYALKRLSIDNERYKSDVSVAIQFLQCNQGNFVAHRLDTLSQDVQTQVSSFMGHKQKTEARRTYHEGKSIKVPIPTFPPTAMVYSVPKSVASEHHRKVEPQPPKEPTEDIVSAAIMAKVLEERLKEKITKHCNTCTCSKEIDELVHQTRETTETQTEIVHSKSDSTQTLKKQQKSSNKDRVKKLSVEEVQTANNIAKVQPNNFLIDEKTYQDPHMHERIDNLLILHRTKAVESGPDASNARDSPKNLLLDNVQRNVHSVLYLPNESKANKAVPHIDASLRNVEKSTSSNTLLQQASSHLGSHKTTLDVSYEEMEENVKKFLFKEKTFLRSMDSPLQDSNRTMANKSASSIETEI